MASIAYVGLDVHKDTISVCVMPAEGMIPIDQARLDADRVALLRCLARWQGQYELRCCYEASGCGYVVYRWLDKAGIACEVIAPSLIPKRSGRRVKTDRIDARKLACLYRAGELTAVRVPSPEEESARRLVRFYDVLSKEVAQTKNQLNKFLSAQGVEYSGKSRWTRGHWAWLRSLALTGPDALVLSEYLGLLEYQTARRDAVDQAIAELAQTEPYREGVAKLSCLRGIRTLTAMVLLTEIGDFARFASPGALMSYLGLVPSEHSSGGKERQGSITKTGNTHGRRVIVEAAWKYAFKPLLSPQLKKRQVGQSASVVAHSWTAQHRLYKKYWSIAARKPPHKAAVAVARELIGFVWAIMTDHCTPKYCASKSVSVAAA